MNDYENFDGLGLAGLVKKGEVSAAELLDVALGRADKLNPKINAIIHEVHDYAKNLIADGLPAGPFEGVPFLLKDMGSPFIGLPHSKGCRALKNHVSQLDSEMARRLLKTGVVPFGKTNAPEFGLMGVTEPQAFGPCRSPWDLQRTPGGSSGGSAAAVAAGITPLATASDGGGSIRIPASCCGIFGLKPSRGRNPLGPAGEGWQGAVVEHIVSRSVRDSAAMLDATNGNDLCAPFQIKPPSTSYLSLLHSEPKSLRIGYNIESPVGQTVDKACVEAVEKTVKLLEELGHQVALAKPDYDGLELARAYFTLYFGEVAAELVELEKQLGRRIVRGDVEITTQTLGLLGHAFSAQEFSTARKYWHRLTVSMAQFHEQYDLYLTPTIAVLPPKIGENEPSALETKVMAIFNALRAGRLLKAMGVVEKLAAESMSKMPFTQIANMTGQPAMSVPLYWTADDIPVGSQFIAPNGREDLLFQLAGQLERTSPWFDKRPAI